MAGVIEYKCPCCGGAIEFNSVIQKMKCPYCDTEFEMETLKSYGEEVSQKHSDEMKWEERLGDEWSEEEKEGMQVFTCQSCGGEIIGDKNTAASVCPYCGNNIVLTGQFSGDLKPDLVIPFKIDKKTAREGLKKHLNGKRLLPKVFKEENHLDEVKGIYVPFWLFQAETNAHIRYRAMKKRSWSDRNFIYTETSHYALIRGGSIGFANVPADGSSKMPDDLMESIEPYDLAEAVDFQTAYLAGYLADKYDVTVDASKERANERIRNSTVQTFRGTVDGGYLNVTTETCNISLKNGQAKYALFPVWLLHTTWNGKNYTFAMNGQTGKFVGNLPVDWKAYFKWLIGLGIGIGALIYACMWLSVWL